MLVIDGTTFDSEDFSPEHSATSNDSIMEDKKIASDNMKVNPMTGDVTLFYTNKSASDDYRDKQLFLEDLLYNRKIFDIFDTVENKIYQSMILIKLGNFNFFGNGFSCIAGFKFTNITETAIPGETKYKGQQTRSTRYKEKPLKQISVESEFLPDDTKIQLKDMGIEEKDGVFNVESLDLDVANLKDGISENILTTLGGNRVAFDIFPDGTMDILSSAGEYLVGGQKLLSNVEFLANLIPGVDYTMKLLPFSKDVVNKVFDITRLGTDWQVVTNEIKKVSGDLGI